MFISVLNISSYCALYFRIIINNTFLSVDTRLINQKCLVFLFGKNFFFFKRDLVSKKDDFESLKISRSFEFGRSSTNNAHHLDSL